MDFPRFESDAQRLLARYIRPLRRQDAEPLCKAE